MTMRNLLNQLPLQISMIALGGAIGIGLVIGTGTALKQGQQGPVIRPQESH